MPLLSFSIQWEPSSGPSPEVGRVPPAHHVTCEEDVGGACFGLVPPAYVSVAELTPAAEFARVRRSGVDQGQLAVALVLPHTAREAEPGHSWASGLAAPLLRGCRHGDPTPTPMVLHRVPSLPTAQTDKSMLGGESVSRGGRPREKPFLKGNSK